MDNTAGQKYKTALVAGTSVTDPSHPCPIISPSRNLNNLVNVVCMSVNTRHVSARMVGDSSE
jgi:hypothetical protein